MPTRIDWADIVKAARETSEDLAGEDWGKAGIKARVLLADLADEVERLRAVDREHAALVDFLIHPEPSGGFFVALPPVGIGVYPGGRYAPSHGMYLFERRADAIAAIRQATGLATAAPPAGPAGD